MFVLPVTQRLHKSQGLSGKWKSSSDWLQTHSLQSIGLSLSQLRYQGTIKTLARSDGSLTRQLEISDNAVREYESELYQAIELYHGKMRWLNQGSMKVFGLVKGSRVGVIVDVSDANCTEERLVDLQVNLLALIEEQLICKRQLYLLSFGTESNSLWDSPVDVNPFRLQQARRWVEELRAGGGCNVLQALKKGFGFGCAQLDYLVLIVGSSPNQSSDVLIEYIEQCMLGRLLSIHAVSYCSSSPVTIHIVKTLAEVVRGRYHIFSASLGIVGSSTDMDLLWAEVKAARELVFDIETLRQGQLGDLAVTVPQQIWTELRCVPDSPSLPESLNHNAPLCIKPPGIQPTSSACWLKSHGLRAKRLGLYQVLSSNAYSSLDKFVPVLNKSVSSTVLEKAMMQCEWHDGTVKNVHVELPSLLNYQRRLLSVMCVLERRVSWLGTGSWHIWGSVCEQRVQVLVDLSVLNSDLSIHIRLSLRVLLEEQLANKHAFNIISFGSVVRPWRENMVPPTAENLQEAWQWVLGLQCTGSKNTLAVLRQALEGSLHGASSHPSSPPNPPLSQGLYLFTSGVPDQEMDAVCSYVSECCSGRPLCLHVCLFPGKGTDTQNRWEAGVAPPTRYTTKDETAGALRQLAQAGNGRFHWISETGILDSDDISALIAEMEKAASYWQKSSMLVESLIQRAGCQCPGNGAAAPSPVVWRHKDGPLPPPRPTTLSLARLKSKESGKESSRDAVLTWRPCSAKAAIPPAQPMIGWSPVGANVKQKKELEVSQSVFYLEDGNNFGVVFKSFPKPKSAWKSYPPLTLPKQEQICSTKQWLKHFGIKKLKLDLHRLVSGPDCTHQKNLIPTVYKTVSSKYCSSFPSVHINGAIRHLLLTPKELHQYLTQTERLLQRYTQRLRWLLSGSRSMFGVVLEREVCILLDVSGSMAIHLGELRKHLACLVWDQLYRNRVRFSLLAFSEEVKVWRPTLQEPSEEACWDAVLWAGQLITHGGTRTLEALQTACGFGERLGMYVLSDGKPDSSCSLVLTETEKLTSGKHITIHTVSYNCTDRYHVWPTTS
ncbi:von Willebrand factor A domain-containing protein 3A isoform X2 [Hypomesus transpacificus]|uniref:von Willebrand factor A domain-containing protein 3A isoform X2 n=1 Tax=Hypomesus transpacificus TaxID=137520 RepID=UPI001F07CF70|nr:von Willebrand factor A domain-containing protein 3A isoform X2 [Hypomesus transpacificus]